MTISTVFQIKKRKRPSVRCDKCERSFVNEYSLRIHLSYFKVILGGLSEIHKFEFVYAMIYLNYYLRLFYKSVYYVVYDLKFHTLKIIMKGL